MYKAESMLKTGKGKASFDGVKTMYLKLTSDQAKLTYILDYIMEKSIQ